MVKTAPQTERTLTVEAPSARKPPTVSAPKPPSSDYDEMFALMLADIDGRLDAVETRTDRLVAQAA